MSNPTTITTEPDTPFIDITREFDATPEQLFRAHTDPALVIRWLGPRRLSMTIDAFDARTGGSYRYLHIDDDDNKYAFHGVFHAVVPNERITQTFEYDGAPGAASLETLTFEDLGGGRTRLRAHSVYPSVESRDAMAVSGMEEGINDSYDRLEELLAS